MTTFLREHLLLVLTIVGAAASFLASLLGLLFQRKPVIVLAVLAVVGFLVGIAYQIEVARRKEASEQIEAAAKRARDNVIQEINLRVKETQITVETIAARLGARSWTEVGTELVTIQTSGAGHFEETVAFAKGSPDEWQRFARWLEQAGGAGAAVSLSLRLNAGNHYDSGLLLAYLLTSPLTRDRLRPVIEQHAAWHTFPAEAAYLDCFSGLGPHLRWILVYRGGSQIPAAFADARAFAQQLVAYHRLGQHDRIDEALNATGQDALEALRKAFPMLQTSVFEAGEPSDLVKIMIERQLPLAVTTSGNRPYLARLERMVRIAAQ